MSLYQWSWDNFVQKDFCTEQCRGKLVFSDLGRRTATAEGNERGTRKVEQRVWSVNNVHCHLHNNVQYTSPHKITETFAMLILMCHCHLQISRHNHFKEWPWTGWRLDLTPKKAPERERQKKCRSHQLFFNWLGPAIKEESVAGISFSLAMTQLAQGRILTFVWPKPI